MVHLIELAFRELYPGEKFSYIPKIKHSAKFNGYNANIRLNPTTRELTVKLSRQWMPVSTDIKKGLVQALLVRLLKKKAHTVNIDLYNHFLRSVSRTAPKTKSHPVLEAAFNRVNEPYFGGLIEQPNFVLGQGTTKLGHYDFGTNTILISEILLRDERLLDYVMYHEMLHKKHQFSSSKGRNSFHSKEFRQDERKFQDSEFLEKELGRLVSNAKRRKWWDIF